MRIKRTFQIWIFSLFLISLCFPPDQTASAAPFLTVSNDQATLNFPDSVTFQADLESNSAITEVALEYGTTELTCGTAIAKAFPQFTSAQSVSVSWTWEMKQSGSLPPGATIWWRWRTTDQSGNQSVSEQKSITWLDSTYAWQTLTSNQLSLHWYRGDQTFAQDLMVAASTGLHRMQNDAGLQLESTVNIYIYGDFNDLKDAILYEPSWTGGLAYPEYDIVIIGISPSNLDWGRDSIVHELTHVLVGHLTFSCLGVVPTWLNEGLAVYSEGQLDPDSAAQLNDAIANNTLMSVRSLSAGFSEVRDKATLSYSESYSIVKYLIETYGQTQMVSLLKSLRDGMTIDEALQSIYGFNVEGLEDKWRAAIGAQPRTASAQPTAQPTPTIVPTYIPFSGGSLSVTPTPYGIPTSTAGGPIPATGNGPPLSLTLILAGTCCVFILLIGVIVLGFILSRQSRKGGDQ